MILVPFALRDCGVGMLGKVADEHHHVPRERSKRMQQSTASSKLLKRITVDYLT